MLYLQRVGKLTEKAQFCSKLANEAHLR